LFSFNASDNNLISSKLTDLLYKFNSSTFNISI
jgi:hypothetical protein